nr:hypothetical protein [Tanacetum cinerariifolium]
MSDISKTRQPPCKFDELLSTPIDFSEYVMNNLNIDNMTQEIMNNPEGHAYLFDLSKPLLLIEDRGRQVVPADYFINNDIEYLKGGSKSSKYMTSTTRTKAARVRKDKDSMHMHATGNLHMMSTPKDELLRKPLLLIEDRGRQVVPADYFINNDIEYLKGGSKSSKYMTSTTRTKAASFTKTVNKRRVKNASTTPTTGVIIKDTPTKSVSKNKAPAKTYRGNGIELLFDAALLEDAQLKKTLRKSKRETHKLQASNSSKGANFESDVPEEQTGKNKDIIKGTGVKPGVLDAGNDDGGNDAEDSEQTNSHDDENHSFTLKDYKEEEQDEEYVHTPEKDKSKKEEKMYEEEDDDVAKELYRELNIT